jgi:branched-chain amino acid transport system permease protein
MRRPGRPPTSKLIIFAVLAFFLLWWVPFSHILPGWVPLGLGTYRTYQASMIAMWAIVALGLNILTGYNGQISLGHGAFVAVGGYTAAILMVDYGWPFPLTIILGGVIAGTLGFLIGIPALRLTGPYLAIATLGLALATPQILKKYDGLTHGTQGINVRSEVSDQVGVLSDFMDDVFGIHLNNDQWVYFLALFIALLMVVLAVNIVRSRIGRAFVAIRDSEIAAQAMGISVPRYKTMAFAISAFYGGIAGGTYAQVVGFVSPESFGFLLSINFLTTIVVGGLASILGSVLGAAGLIVVPEMPGLVSFIPGAGLPDELSWAFYGAALILVMVFAPYGLAGLFRRFVRWVSSWPAAWRAGILAGLVLGVVARVVAGELAGAGVGLVLGLVAFCAITAWIWGPALTRAGAGGYSRSVEALRGIRSSPGQTGAGSEDGSSENHPDAER